MNHRSPPKKAKSFETTLHADSLRLGKATEKLRVNPRKSWYRNLDSVTTTVTMKPPSGSSGRSPRSSRCWRRASPRIPVQRSAGADAAAPGRHRAVQVRRVQAQRIKQSRAQSGLLEPRPAHLDRIEYTVIRNTSTAILALASGKLDRTWPGIVPIALMREIKSQAPQIECEINAWNIPRLLIINLAFPLRVFQTSTPSPATARD